MLRWVLTAAVGLAICTGAGGAKGRHAAKRPRVTALVGFPFHGRFPACVTEEPAEMLMVVGAYLSQRGWMSSDDTGGLMRKGDRLPLYGLVSGRIGSVRLLAAHGPVAKKDRVSFPRGFGSGAKVQFRRSLRSRQRHDWQIALWHALGTPAPRWVPAREVDPRRRTYRRLASTWLRRQGLGRREVQAVRIEQVLGADLNGDGRDEILLSLNWEEPGEPDGFDLAPHLLIYSPAHGSTPAHTALLAKGPGLGLWVMGLCDLNRDGQAEIIASHSDGERWGTRLYYHTPHGYRFVEGDLNGY